MRTFDVFACVTGVQKQGDLCCSNRLQVRTHDGHDLTSRHHEDTACSAGDSQRLHERGADFTRLEIGRHLSEVTAPLIRSLPSVLRMSPNVLTRILLSWKTAQKHGRLLIYLADHLALRFWEALSGICSRTIPHPDSQVNRLCISPDKRFLAAAGHHTVKLYDIRSTNPAAVLTFEGHTGNITGVAFHCEGKWMVTSSEDGRKSKSLKQIVLRF
jgi:WD40 repeat protein